jgi:hypothetical protein
MSFGAVLRRLSENWTFGKEKPNICFGKELIVSISQIDVLKPKQKENGALRIALEKCSLEPIDRKHHHLIENLSCHLFPIFSAKEEHDRHRKIRVNQRIL